jgi:hypothetical protein
MDAQPKKRGGPLYWLKRRSRWFWIVITVLLPVSYVASFGPVCWITMKRHPALYVDAPTFYWPLGTAIHYTGPMVWD